MRASFVTLAACLTLASAALAGAPSRADLHKTSWGKPGVSFEQYRDDAVQCALEASSYDITKAPVGQKLIAFNKQQELASLYGWMDAPTPWGGVGAVGVARNGPWLEHFQDTEYLETRDLQYGLLGHCLRERGYLQFRLTAQQIRTLDRLGRGSDARRAYLHSLASDPVVMAHQALTAL